MQCLKLRSGVFPVKELTLSVEFTLNVRLAVIGLRILISFCRLKKTIIWFRREKMYRSDRQLLTW